MSWDGQADDGSTRIVGQKTEVSIFMKESLN